jgi:plasmid stability protein
MAALSIRGLDDDVRDRLRVRAARNGRSMEAEIRAILTAAVAERDEEQNLVAALVARDAAVGRVDLDVPPRVTPVRAAGLLDDHR